MIGTVFVDTNVIVYRHAASDPVKQARADDWYELLWRLRIGRLSFQVLQETYNTLTRKLQPAMADSEAQLIVRGLAAWKPVPVSLAILERGWRMQGRYSVSWWDALIVAAAQVPRCAILLTEDLQRGQVFESVRVINPFDSPDHTPAQILEVEYP
jgi:predicted nucleic acid-binding protein